jgi:Starch-binding associating with outer membrane
MKKQIISILALAIIMFANACTKDFDTINQNPNAPTEVTPNLLLPAIQRDMINQLMGETWGIGNIVIQHTAKNQFVNEDRYLWGEINGIWNTGYNKLRDVQGLIAIAEENDLKNYKGVALVMRSWIFSLITDAYGDCPYSQAIRGKEDGIYYPKYDTQESIYNGILADLAAANDLLGTGSETVSGDLIYKGNLTKWKKLANSLRVRALMRISRKRNVGAELAAIVSDPAKFPLMESNDDNGVYTYAATNPDQFPLFSSRIGSFNEFRASQTLTTYLQSTNDPRVAIFFRPTPATIGTDSAVIRGIPNGLDDVTSQTIFGGQQNHSQIGTIYYEGAISADGIKIAKGVIMTNAELRFLLAEAAEKNLISGNPEDYYRAGITSSYQFYGLTPTTEFFAQPEIAYTGDQTEKLRKIGTQKWASLYYQGLEAWFDWRRTRIPALVPSAANQNNNLIPVRFYYPRSSEEPLNGANLNEAVTRQGPDNLNTLMWHLK